jgi:hypothetical protein
LFTVRHLFDGGIDKRFSSTNNALMNLPYHLKRLIVEKPFDPEEDISDGLIKVSLLNYMNFLINNLILDIYCFFTR